jgi:NADH-quinone oxidoreductase subunit E
MSIAHNDATQNDGRVTLSAAALARIDHAIAKYPADQRQSAVMAALAIAQDEHGWLSTGVMDAVAEKLAMPPVAVYEVATFYSMYNLAPVGRYKLAVCTNLPCALSGGAAAGEYLKKTLGIDYGETTADGCFTLQEGECMGACGDAPVLLANNKRMCCRMSNDKLDALIAELRAEAGKGGAAD